MKAVGQFAGGISAYDAGKYTRRAMQTNAQNAGNAGLEERERIRGAARAAIGQQLVDQGGSGFTMGTGSAIDALQQSAMNRELDLAVSRRNASMKAAGFEQQGQIAYAQGKAAMVGGIISGVETIAEEVASAAAGGMPTGGGGGAPAAAPGASSPYLGGSGGYQSGEYQLGGGTDSYFASNPFGGSL
jgi:hypothetical protein